MYPKCEIPYQTEPVEALHPREGGSADLVEGLDGYEFAPDVDDGGALGGGDAHFLEGSGMMRCFVLRCTSQLPTLFNHHELFDKIGC